MKPKSKMNTEPQAEINTVLYAVAPTPKLSTDTKALDSVSEKSGLCVGATSKPSVRLMNIDCKTYMRTVPDKYYQLAIVDPPYGIGENWKKDRYSKFYSHQSTYKNNEIPDADYFKELFRVSVNQIIFGANYYTEHLPARQGWIVWDKNRSWKQSHLAEGELAWHSFNVPLRIVKNTWNGFIRSEKRHGAHPHEKPVGLYKWVLDNYATPGDKILDTHLGSGSIAIACHDYGYSLDACEIDEQYFNDTMDRYNNHILQTRLFNK